MRFIVRSTHFMLARRQFFTGPGCVVSVVGLGGRSCGQGGFATGAAVAAVAHASAATAVAAAADPQPRVGFLPSNLV
jgi:hypothetical protein